MLYSFYILISGPQVFSSLQ